MSEFSSSYHIRTDDGENTELRLRRNGFNGIVFGPANGWLTYVPFANLERFRREAEFPNFGLVLVGILERPVLHYRYGEDHGWSFALVYPGGTVSRYACWWDPQQLIERDDLNLEALRTLAPLDALEPILRACNRQAAHRFAELLGLPAYKWLSPELAQRQPADFVAEGGRKIGSKPPDTSERLKVPPNRQIAIPRPDLSAREALSLVEPFTANFLPPWHLASLSTYGHLQTDGRGVWRFSYRYANTGDLIHVALMADGRLRFDGVSLPAPTLFNLSKLPTPVSLPDGSLDSTEIAAIAARQPIPVRLDRPLKLGLMGLTPRREMPLFWDVNYVHMAIGEGLTSWMLAINVADGEVIMEKFQRSANGTIIDGRKRVKNADWEELRAGDTAHTL